VPQGSYEEFTADFRNVAATLYLLQTAIQGLIDLASQRVAEHAAGTPRTSHGLFETLEERGLVPQGTAAKAGPIVGFRNRVVHLYDRVDERRVYEVLVEHRHDIAELVDVLLAIPPA
jgi:uncharacterized protein YutE (UPF0331/DUF86 family)